MVNSWSLVYEELYGDMDKEYPIKEDVMSKSPYWYEYDRNDPKRRDPFGEVQDTLNVGYQFGNASPDTITFKNDATPVVFTGSGLPGGMGDDHITFSVKTDAKDIQLALEGDTKPKPNLVDGSSRKYQEDKGINDLKDYVASTYSGHYTNNNSDVQTLDLIHSVGDAESFCRSNAIKYLSRYDKKGQAKRDILKAMHYCLLLYYFSGQTNETPTRGYETF